MGEADDFHLVVERVFEKIGPIACHHGAYERHG